MPREALHQPSFTAGEIDPLLAAREDFDDYYKAVDRARNVIAQPTGGLTRRGGAEYIDTLPTNSTYWKNNGENIYRLIRFSAREDEKYMTVLTHNGSDSVLKLYRDTGSTFNVTTLDGGDAAVALPYSADEIEYVDWAQKLDVLLLFHEDYKPRKVERTGTDSFTVDKQTFDNIPQNDFSDGNSPSEQNEKQKISFSGMTDGDSYDLSLEGEVSAEIEWDGTSSNNASRLESELRRLPNTSNDGINVTHLSGDDYEVEFAGNDGSFNWDKIIVSIFTGDGSASVSVTQEGESGDENAWSSTRGWPKHGTFYQSRLWLGGSKEMPETVWGSKTGNFFDFGSGDAGDDDAVQATIDSDQVSAINWIFAGRNLIVGTDKVEYYVPEEPITPSNVRFSATTRRGTEESVKPVEIDGALYYIQRGGKSLRQYLFSFSEDSYKSKNISLLASHLINDPISMSLRRSTQTDIADLIFIVNDESGDAATLSLLRSEEVIAFTESVTKGRFRNTRSMDFDNYFIVERDIPEKSDITNDWDGKADLPTAREGVASAQNDGYLHVIGGSESGGEVRKHQRYSFDNDKWEESASLPQQRSQGSADFLDETLYYGGGVDAGGNDVATLYEFRDDANAWETKNDMPVATSDHKLVTTNEDLYLVAPKETHQYKPNKDEWDSKTAMPTELHNFSAVAYDGSIYVFGGEDKNGTVVKTVQEYDVSNDSWSQKTDMSTARRNSVAEVAEQSTGDEIWVIGGYNGTSTVKTNEAYDISGDSWSSNADMTTARERAGSGIDNLKMHVIGGDNSGDVANNERYGYLQPVYHLERMNADHLLDASERKTSGISSKKISGFDHLQGETVDVHADGFYKGEKTVDSNGDVTLDDEAEDYVEVGYDLVEPKVTTLKATLQAGQNTISQRKKRIVEATLQLYKTKGIALNGNRVSFRNLGDSLLNQEIPAFTGDKEIDGITGWDEQVQLEITQPEPQPMTLLGIIQVVSF